MTPKVTNEFKAAFSKRFRDACNDNPRIPPLNRGLYGYISSRMTERGIPTTNQAVQKWYNGASIPGRDRLVVLADIIGSDPDYLLIGSTAKETHRPTPLGVIEKNGAANVVIGVLEMMGVNCAVVEDGEPGDVFALRSGKVTRLLTRGVIDVSNPVSFTLPTDHYRSKLMTLTLDESGSVMYFHIPADLIEQYGEKGNGFVALTVTFADDSLDFGGMVLPKLNSPLEILN